MNIQSLPNKRQYAHAWRRVVDIAKHSPQLPLQVLTWYAVPAAQVRRDFIRALHQRINTRGHLVTYETRRRDDRRALRELRARYTHECRWCGLSIPYAPQDSQRFCSAECRHCYYS